MNATTTTNSKTNVGQTILAQLGGGMFRAMTGAKTFGTNGNDLSFRLPSNFAKQGINYVRIELTAADDYAITFGKIRGTTYKVIAETAGVFCGELRNVIAAQTGLALSLGNMKGAAR